MIIAHAETDATRRGAFACDESINARGRAALAGLGALPQATALCAPSNAASETARLLGLQAEIEPALRDLEVGRWRGASLADIADQTPDAAAAWVRDPAFNGHGGELIADLVARVGAWLAARLAEDGAIVAVTHAAVLRAAAVAALGAGAPAFWRIDAAPLTALLLGGDQRRWALRALGPLEGLRAQLR